MPALPIRRIAPPLVLAAAAAVAAGAGLTASPSAAAKPHTVVPPSAAAAGRSPSGATSMHEIGRNFSKRCDLSIVVRAGGTDVNPRLVLVVPPDKVSKTLRYRYTDFRVEKSGVIRSRRTLLPLYKGSVDVSVYDDSLSYYPWCTSVGWNLTATDQYLDFDGRFQIPRVATRGKPLHFANDPADDTSPGDPFNVVSAA